MHLVSSQNDNKHIMKKTESSGNVLLSGEIVTNVSHKKAGIVHKSSCESSYTSRSYTPKRRESSSTEIIKYKGLREELEISKASSSKSLAKSTFSSLSKFYDESVKNASEQNVLDLGIEKSFLNDEKLPIKIEEQGSLSQKKINDKGNEDVIDYVQILKLSKAKPVKRRSKQTNKTKIEQKVLESKAILKETKAPDPFKNCHPKTKSDLKRIIANTSSPENPLYHLRLSGINTPSIAKSYRHFVISLFESIHFMQKMEPIKEEIIMKKKHILARPQNISCKEHNISLNNSK